MECVENSHLVGSHSVLAVLRIPYGKSGMQDILKIMKSQKTGSKTFWSNHSLIGQAFNVCFPNSSQSVIFCYFFSL